MVFMGGKLGGGPIDWSSGMLWIKMGALFSQE
jgi:hypothetical protein